MTRPSAMATAPSVMMLSVCPMAFIKANVISSVMGTTSTTTAWRGPQVAQEQEEHDHGERAAHRDGLDDTGFRLAHDFGLIVENIGLHPAGTAP